MFAITQGSIKSGVTVSGIVIQNNTIINKFVSSVHYRRRQILNDIFLSSDQALRIKTDSDATDALVTNVTYSGNVAQGMRQFGLLIDQSYPDTLGTPGTGCIISVSYTSS